MIESIRSCTKIQGLYYKRVVDSLQSVVHEVILLTHQEAVKSITTSLLLESSIRVWNSPCVLTKATMAYVSFYIKQDWIGGLTVCFVLCFYASAAGTRTTWYGSTVRYPGTIRYKFAARFYAFTRSPMKISLLLFLFLRWLVPPVYVPVSFLSRIRYRCGNRLVPKRGIMMYNTLF